MDRSDIATYMWGRLGAMFTEVGIDNADTTGDLKEPIDDTFLALGVNYADLASATSASSDVRAARSLAYYYGLISIRDAALNRVDESKSNGAPSVSLSRSRSQFVDNVNAAIDQAEKAATPYLPVVDSWVEGSLETGTFLYDGTAYG